MKLEFTPEELAAFLSALSAEGSREMADKMLKILKVMQAEPQPKPGSLKDIQMKRLAREKEEAEKATAISAAEKEETK